MKKRSRKYTDPTANFKPVKNARLNCIPDWIVVDDVNAMDCGDDSIEWGLPETSSVQDQPLDRVGTAENQNTEIRSGLDINTINSKIEEIHILLEELYRMKEFFETTKDRDVCTYLC